MSVKVFFFILTTIVGFIPTVFFMRKSGKKLGWWKGLTIYGKGYIVLFVSFLIVGIYLTYIEESESNRKESLLLATIKSDSISRELLESKLTYFIETDSSYKAALKKGGYKYDSINRTIIGPRINIQQIETGSSGLQNNAPNYGNQAGRDITISNERVLSTTELNEIVEFAKKTMNDSNLKCLNVLFENRSNGNKVYAQLKDAFERAGLNPMGGIVLMSQIEEGIIYKIDKDNCLTFTVGLFK